MVARAFNKHSLRRMLEHGYGRIVTVGSWGAVEPTPPTLEKKLALLQKLRDELGSGDTIRLAALYCSCNVR
jgi:NAD(P)-dependent dehydrogenase (short-subunit alcohol dehydrogenase family)